MTASFRSSIALLVWACAVAPAASAQQIRADIVGFELVDVALDSATADILVEVESERRVRVRSFQFHRISANGMPAFIDPVFEPVEIAAGERSPLPALRATIRFRDADGLGPLRTLLEEARIHIAGTARVEVELGWMERLATWSRRGEVWRAFDETLDVDIPGGRVRELSSRALLALAEPVAQAGLELHRKTEEWLDEEWAPSMQSVAAVRTVYSYRAGGGAPVRVETVASGVVVSPQRILVPLEAIEP